MTTVFEAKTETIWVIGENGHPKETNFYDWVMNFQDENRLTVEFFEDLDPENYSNGVYKLRYHRVNRPSVLLDELFETEEAAEDEKFDRILRYDFERSIENTSYFHSIEDAENDIVETIENKYNIDKEVAASIYRKKKIVDSIRAERDAVRQKEWAKEAAERKSWLEKSVPAEAESIMIDEDFKAAVKSASLLTGKIKSEAMATAFNHLLYRQKFGEIKSDFWQVFRILKAKIAQ